jgi:hypothetical protein
MRISSFDTHSLELPFGAQRVEKQIRTSERPRFSKIQQTTLQVQDVSF